MTRIYKLHPILIVFFILLNVHCAVSNYRYRYRHNQVKQQQHAAMDIFSAAATAAETATSGTDTPCITNPSFESGEEGWILNGLGGLDITVANASYVLNAYKWPDFQNEPTDGLLNIVHGFDSTGPVGSFLLTTQDPVSLLDCAPIGCEISNATLYFDYRFAWDLTSNNPRATMDRVFKVEILTADDPPTTLEQHIIFEMPVGTTNDDSGGLTGSVDLTSVIDEEIIIQFEWFVPEIFRGSAIATLDNIRTVFDVDCAATTTTTPTTTTVRESESESGDSSDSAADISWSDSGDGASLSALFSDINKDNFNGETRTHYNIIASFSKSIVESLWIIFIVFMVANVCVILCYLRRKKTLQPNGRVTV